MKIERNDRIGLIHPAIDAHTLGIVSFSQLMTECRIPAIVADDEVNRDLELLAAGTGGRVLSAWLQNEGISILGFSYRLDPADAAEKFGHLHDFLCRQRMLAAYGGRIRGLLFAGLPEACSMIQERYPRVGCLFKGDETPEETLALLGISVQMLPASLYGGMGYDTERMQLGREIINAGDYLDEQPAPAATYPQFGQRGDTVNARISNYGQRGMLPLIRVHAGPYLPDRKEAVALFGDWTRTLASSGFLDVLSIGTSQLTQSNFGEDWQGKNNGGGVPINSAAEFAGVWEAARPMLVRTYAGSNNIISLARLYEETIDNAWHALSFWWFCQIDGRGPNRVLANLHEHFAAIKYIASTGKAFEPNVPHHFAFRGSDDLSYVVSGYVAAKAAKKCGIHSLILQTMLNTPKTTWGIQDLAKARALTRLVRTLEDESFKVFLQPRGGLDYFSPDPAKAKAQLAAVTMLMDDIEPDSVSSPQIIHVVSYSEACRLADPPIMIESIKIARYALHQYRKAKTCGFLFGFLNGEELKYRESALLDDARKMVSTLESLIPDLYSPEGFYRMMVAGVFPLPWLTSCREEFPAAVSIQTKMACGGIKAVDSAGRVLLIGERIAMITENLKRQEVGV
ncbi:MAG: hypothetical protein LLF89_09735 [Spirochaetaceae bacterium]|nr:hypothetical protein [Spirochaetaceae bacterium]